jgi:hypothetical protein
MTKSCASCMEELNLQSAVLAFRHHILSHTLYFLKQHYRSKAGNEPSILSWLYIYSIEIVYVTKVWFVPYE